MLYLWFAKLLPGMALDKIYQATVTYVSQLKELASLAQPEDKDFLTM